MRADVKRSHPGEEAVKVPRVRGMEQQGVAAEPGQLVLLEHMESSEGLRRGWQKPCEGAHGSCSSGDGTRSHCLPPAAGSAFFTMVLWVLLLLGGAFCP